MHSGWRTFGSVPGHGGVVVQLGGNQLELNWNAGRRGQRGQRGGIESSYIGYVGEVDKLQQVAELGAVFDADVLVLVVEVFAPLGDADGGEAFFVEAGVVTSAQVPVRSRFSSSVCFS